MKTPLQLWDDRWCRWYDRVVERGKTPNEAIPIAYRLTEDQRGLRPDGTAQAEVRSA